ncbi:MAG: ABC transporter ATP-binding protein [Halapricum sp.]
MTVEQDPEDPVASEFGDSDPGRANAGTSGNQGAVTHRPGSSPSDGAQPPVRATDVASHSATGSAAQPLVSVEARRKPYGDGEDAVTTVDGVSFAVEAGEAVGLLGPNGAGKTTIKVLLGLVVATSGTAQVGGVDVQEDPAEASRHVGAMLAGAQNVYWRLTVMETLQFFAALAGQRPATVRDRHEQVLEQFGIADRADAAVRELSRGQKQKVSLACTLARGADVAFLDEPTLGLDVESSLALRRDLRRFVDEEGLSLVGSSHDMDVIEDVCDRVVIMSDGGIVADDGVENLLEVSRTQTYRVQVEGTVPAEVREGLVETFDAESFEQRGARESFELLVTGDEVYGMVDTLRAEGCHVASVDVVEPDLELVSSTSRKTAADRPGTPTPPGEVTGREPCDRDGGDGDR